jgi:hypothetical protein
MTSPFIENNDQSDVYRWRYLQMQMHEAIAKQKSVELDCRQAW